MILYIWKETTNTKEIATILISKGFPSISLILNEIWSVNKLYNMPKSIATNVKRAINFVKMNLFSSSKELHSSFINWIHSIIFRIDFGSLGSGFLVRFNYSTHFNAKLQLGQFPTSDRNGKLHRGHLWIFCSGVPLKILYNKIAPAIIAAPSINASHALEEDFSAIII